MGEGSKGLCAARTLCTGPVPSPGCRVPMAPAVSRYHPGEPQLWLFTLLGLQLCQPHGAARATQPTWDLGSLWLSLSSGPVKADVPLGPAAGSALGKTQLCRELLCRGKKSFSRKFPARRAVCFQAVGCWKWRRARPPRARGAGGACVHGHTQSCRRDAAFPARAGCSPGAVWRVKFSG